MVKEVVKSLIIRLILVYQKAISPLIASGFGIHCRFYPSCSEYTLIAVKKFGVLKGLFLGIKRFLRCNPLFQGGYDPVPEDFSLKEVFARWTKGH
jgi:putative membrane protein insertion efficiency factor